MKSAPVRKNPKICAEKKKSGVDNRSPCSCSRILYWMDLVLVGVAVARCRLCWQSTRTNNSTSNSTSTETRRTTDGVPSRHILYRRTCVALTLYLAELAEKGENLHRVRTVHVAQAVADLAEIFLNPLLELDVGISFFLRHCQHLHLLRRAITRTKKWHTTSCCRCRCTCYWFGSCYSGVCLTKQQQQQQVPSAKSRPWDGERWKPYSTKGNKISMGCWEIEKTGENSFFAAPHLVGNARQAQDALSPKLHTLWVAQEHPS